GVALDLLLVRAVEVAAARDEDVEQPVAVVVDQGDAAAERLQDGQVGAGVLAVAVGDVDARGGVHFREQVRALQVGVRRRRGGKGIFGRVCTTGPDGQQRRGQRQPSQTFAHRSPLLPHSCSGWCCPVLLPSPLGERGAGKVDTLNRTRDQSGEKG